MQPQPLTAAAAALALFVSLLWGGNIAAIKLGLDTFPTFWSAFWRFFSAAAAVLIYARFQRVSLRPSREEWGPLAALAAMFAAQITCLNIGTGWTSAAYAVVLLNAHPLFTNAIGQFTALEEKLTPRRVLGLLIAFAGICWLALGRPEERLAPFPVGGNVLVTVSALLLASRIIYTRRIVQAAHPLKPVIWQMLLALPVFLVPALLYEPVALKPIEWEAVAAILYQGPVVGGVCFVVWTTLLRHYSASTLSIFAFTVPFFGVLLSACLFDEAIGGRLIAGAVLATAGIWIVTRAPKSAIDVSRTESAAREPAR